MFPGLLLATLVSSANAGERPPPSYLFAPVAGEVVPIGPGPAVADGLAARGVELDRIGWGAGLFVGPAARDGLAMGQQMPTLFRINGALQSGEVDCGVWVNSYFGSHVAVLYGDCHPGSGDAYLKRARGIRGAAVLSGVLGAAAIGGGAYLMSNAPQNGLFISDQWWGGLFLASAGVGLVVSVPVNLGIAGGMTRYGRSLHGSSGI